MKGIDVTQAIHLLLPDSEKCHEKLNKALLIHQFPHTFGGSDVGTVVRIRVVEIDELVGYEWCQRVG